MRNARRRARTRPTASHRVRRAACADDVRAIVWAVAAVNVVFAAARARIAMLRAQCNRSLQAHTTRESQSGNRTNANKQRECVTRNKYRHRHNTTPRAVTCYPDRCPRDARRLRQHKRAVITQRTRNRFAARRRAAQSAHNVEVSGHCLRCREPVAAVLCCSPLQHKRAKCEIVKMFEAIA